MKKIFLGLAICFSTFISCNKSNNMDNKAAYSGRDISDSIAISRDKQTKEATLKIDISEPWSLYAGTSVDNIDMSKAILEGNKAGSYHLAVNDSTRSYFKLITPSSSMILAERHLPMTGGYNFRDLGGIKTKDGKFVKWGKILRSDDLNKLTDADLNYISSVPLTTIVDFRSKEEINATPDKLPNSINEDFQLSITPGNLMAAAHITDLDSTQVDSLMMQLNVLLVSDSSSIAQYKKFFELLQNEKEVPLMFHCSAGKDRTGMGAALVLFSLGVDEEVIFNDYLASNYYLADKYSKYINENPNLKAFFEVKREFLKSGIDYMIQEYGSVDNYLAKVLNVDLAKMKEMYLY